MASTIESEIILYQGVPLDNTYRNVINGGISKLSLSGYILGDGQKSAQTYCRIVGQFNNKVRIDTGSHFADYYMNANYISIENKSGVVIFGFITDVLYINDNVVEITFEIDCFHTYYGNYDFCQCLIERATPDTAWSPSDYSLPDYFEETEYLTVATDNWTPLGDNLLLVLFFAPPKGRTYATADTPISDTGIMSGFVTGCYVIAVDGYNASQTDIDNFRNVINTCYKSYHLDCINAVLMPTALYNTYNQVFSASSTGNITTVNGWLTNAISTNNLNGTTIKNNKLFTYPYTFLEVTNNLGDVKRYAWEGWGDLGAQFEVRAVSVPTPTITLIPRYYFGKDYDFENSITIDNFPCMPVQADTIGTWLAQNNTASALKALGATASGAVAGAMVGPVGAAVGGVMGAVGSGIDYVGKLSTANNTPSRMTSMGGSGSPIMLPQIEKLGFTFRAKCIRGEAIQAIDDYFTRFGIAEKSLRLPPLSRNVRGKYLYIKTNDCTIRSKGDSGMPVWAERKICEIHDKGVTYWTSLSSVGNYG